jgi:putative SOS response-associated peptidase YedK
VNGFWLDPPAPNDPTRLAPAWDAIVSYMLPPARRFVRPLRRARIVITTTAGLAIVPSVLGLVPSWASSGERRPLAARHAALDAQLAPNSTITGEIWEASRRCLVAASGWVARDSLGSVLAFAPETPPVTFAGLYNTVHLEDRGAVNTFGVFVRTCSFGPYDGSPVPIVIRPEDRNRWMSGPPNSVRSLLKVPGMKIYVKRIVNETTDLADIYGAGYSDDYPMQAQQLGPVRTT